jgi:hypothetical protein
MRFLYFLKNIILNNKAKVCLWSITLFLLYFPIIRGIDDNKIDCTVKQICEVDGRYLTIYKRPDKTESEYFVSESVKKPVYTDNHLAIFETSGFFAFCVLVGGIGGLICIMTFFVDDKADGWEISTNWINARLQCIECHLEGDYHYYIYRNRLICKADQPLTDYDLRRFLERSNIKLYPKFETKKQRRERNLTQLES